ncbi:histidine phosphatase family protein [Candidatus Micrarchaeota archaeon]|nr:histidine phosphatase family protein [Candidatus Micrarchaeota archaeon]
MKRLFVVRHARSTGNDARVYEGWNGGSLTRKGVQQARKLGKFFRDIPLDVVYCSDLLRAKQTLEEMNLGLKTVFDPRLRERDYGIHNGEPYGFMGENTSFDDFYLNYRLKPKNGESLIEVRKRVVSFFNFVEKQKHETALVVTHHNPSMLLIGLASQTPLWNWRVFVQSNACVNQLVNEGGVWRIARINDTSHLH